MATRVGGWLLNATLIIGFVSCTVAIAKSPAEAPSDVVRLTQVGESDVWRLHDSQTGADCYVIPQAFCHGECAYSPAISCVK